jgi:hypothetical protein
MGRMLESCAKYGMFSREGNLSTAYQDGNCPQNHRFEDFVRNLKKKTRKHSVPKKKNLFPFLGEESETPTL